MIDVLTADGPALDNLRDLFKAYDMRVTSPERMRCIKEHTRPEFTAKDKEIAQCLKANKRPTLNVLKEPWGGRRQKKIFQKHQPKIGVSNHLRHYYEFVV